jgi:hypothetical protein
LVWQADQDDRCARCNQPRSESFHPDSEDGYHVRRLVCHACKAVSEDVAVLTDHKSTQFMFFIPELDHPELDEEGHG